MTQIYQIYVETFYPKGCPFDAGEVTIVDLCASFVPFLSCNKQEDQSQGELGHRNLLTCKTAWKSLKTRDESPSKHLLDKLSTF